MFILNVRRFPSWAIFVFCGSAFLAIDSARGQTWVEFVDETSTRLVADSSVGTADTDEKDYDWADIDKDGDIDLVCVRKQEWTTEGRRRNVLFMNEGIKEGHAINGVLVDRTEDYATASEVAGSQGFLDLTNDRDVKLVDLDGDGWLDMVTSTTLSGDQAKYISHPRVYINLGDDVNGNWQGFVFDDANRAPTMPDEPRFCAVGFGDIDADGDADLYFSDYDQPVFPPQDARDIDLNDRLWINDGSGYFTDESSARMLGDALESNFGMSNAIADMNGDGALDIVKDSGCQQPIHIGISYNDLDDLGNFDNFTKPYKNAPYFVTVGDLNNDDRLDFVVSDDTTDRYVLNQGNGADDIPEFTTHLVTYTGGESDDGFSGNSDMVDLNNDGWLDVIIADVDVNDGFTDGGCGRRMHIYRNLGNAPTITLQEQTVGTSCGNPNSTTCTVVGITNVKLKGTHDAAPFDINGDGWLDLVVGRCSSTEVYMNVPLVGLAFSYPTGLPSFITPDQDLTFQVQVTGIDAGVPEPGTGMLHLSMDDGPVVSTSMSQISDNLYEATLPAADCLTKYSFYVTAETTLGVEFSDPLEAPASTYIALASLGEEITLRDEIEGDVSAWTIASDPGLTSGTWVQADPIQTFNTQCGIVSPEEDASGAEGVMAFMTQNGTGSPGSHDVDSGATYLTTPVIDLEGSDATISYARWFVTCNGTPDTLDIKVSNDGGDSWVLVEAVTGTANQWETVSFLVSDYVTPTAEIQVRYTASDFDASITDAGIDNFEVRQILCPDATACEGDSNGDGLVDPLDAGYVLARFACSVGTGDTACDAADTNLDGTVDPLDYGFVLARFGACE